MRSGGEPIVDNRHSRSRLMYAFRRLSGRHHAQNRQLKRSKASLWYAVPFVEKFSQRARPTHWRPLGARANVALRFLHVLAPFSRRSLLNVPDGLCIAIYSFFHFPVHHLSVVEACGSEMLLGVYPSDRISEFQSTRRYPKGKCCS